MTLVQGIGLESGRIRIDIICSVNEAAWRDRMAMIKTDIYPCLRWVGARKANAGAGNASEQPCHLNLVPSGEVHGVKV